MLLLLVTREPVGLDGYIFMSGKDKLKNWGCIMKKKVSNILKYSRFRNVSQIKQKNYVYYRLSTRS